MEINKSLKNNYLFSKEEISIIRTRIFQESFSKESIDKIIRRASLFYEHFEKSGNIDYAITPKTMRKWSFERAGCGNSFRRFIKKAPLIVVLTQYVNERTALRDLYFEEMNKDDYLESLLNPVDDSSPFDVANLLVDMRKEEDNKKFLEFKKICHAKRCRFIKVYFEKVLYDFNSNLLDESLRRYEDIKDIYYEILKLNSLKIISK